MSFEQYVVLNEETAILFLCEKISFFDGDSKLSCKEIGDGNLNFVYRIMDEVSKKSIIIKQAAAYARATPDYKLTSERGRMEAEILVCQNKLSKGFVPEVYLYDEIMCCCIMEDLRDYKILREELIKQNTYPQFAGQIAGFLANTLIRTTDIVMDSTEKKENVRHFINPELCKISEELVFTDPYTNVGNTNDVFGPSFSYVEKEIYKNAPLQLEAGKLSVHFKNFAQSLIHGDLHSGSIFIRDNSTKVFDPEFAFYGPAGYDIGTVIGNLMFSWVAAAVQDEGNARAFKNWIEQTVIDIVDIFSCCSVDIITTSALNPLYRSEEFANWYINCILCDAAGYAGMEIIRRVVGEAHVKDITQLPDNLRAQAEVMLIKIGQQLMLHRKEYKCGKDFSNVLQFEN